MGLRLSITTKAKFASGKTYKSHNKEMWASTEGVAGLSLRLPAEKREINSCLKNPHQTVTQVAEGVLSTLMEPLV